MSLESEKRNIKHESLFLKWSIIVIAWCTIIYQMVSTQIILTSAMEHQIHHLGFVLLLISLSAANTEKRQIGKYLWIGVAIVSLVSIIYIKIFYEHLEEVIGFPLINDAIMGVVLMVVIIACTYKSWGLVFPLIAAAGLGYFFLGHLLPNVLFHHKISFLQGISTLSIGFGSGIFGRYLAVMSDFAFLLVFFGALLETMGANMFFLEMGKIGGKISHGGPAQTAVIGSSLVGMSSGSAIGNVMITGSFTIPTMKRFGYKSEMAGAIEAAASAGSQIMPPIMGATAFLMSAFIGIPYTVIMVGGIFPAFLYYLAVALNVEFYARKNKMKPADEKISYQTIFERAPVFMIPLGFLTALLIMQKSPGYTTFYAILLVLIIGFMRKGTRPSLKKLSEGIVTGAVSASKITIVIATVAMITQVVITTGLGTKMAHIVGMISAGNLLITLIMAMILSIFLGCGLPSSAAYALVAILIAPSIINMGIPTLQIHFFILYFAIISCITPPVAFASLAAAAIAQSNYARTGYEAFKLGLSGYIIPFFIVFNPIFIMQFDKTVSIVDIIYSLVAASSLIVCISIVSYGYIFSKVPIYMRILVALVGIFMGGYALSLQQPMFYIGIFLGLVFIFWRTLQNRNRNRQKEYQESLTQKPITELGGTR